VVAFNKADGAYVEQYQLAGGNDAWAGLAGMTVIVPPDDTVPPTLWWISSTGVHTVSLAAAPDASGASPSPSASATPSIAPTKAPKPTKSPKP